MLFMYIRNYIIIAIASFVPILSTTKLVDTNLRFVLFFILGIASYLFVKYNLSARHKVMRFVILAINLIIGLLMVDIDLNYGFTSNDTLVELLTIIFYLGSYSYIKGNTTNIFTFAILTILMIAPWSLMVIWLFLNFMYGIRDNYVTAYIITVILWIPAVYLAVRYNLNIYTRGFLTINQIPMWLSLIVSIYAIGFSSEKIKYIFLAAIVSYGTMFYMFFSTYKKIKSIATEVFGKDCFGKRSGFNSATRMIQVVQFSKGRYTGIKTDTGDILVIDFSKQIVAGFNYYNDFASLETSGLNNCRLTFRFYNKNLPEISIFDTSAPVVEQYIADLRPDDPNAGFKELVASVVKNNPRTASYDVY